MRPCLCLFKIEPCAADNNLLLMLKIIIQHLLKGKYPRLIVHKRQHYRAEGFLKLSVLIEEIKHDIRIYILLQFHYKPHAVFVGFIAQCA